MQPVNQQKQDFLNRVNSVGSFFKNLYQGAKTNLKSGNGILGDLSPHPTIPNTQIPSSNTSATNTNPVINSPAAQTFIKNQTTPITPTPTTSTPTDASGIPEYDAQGGFTSGGKYYAPDSIQAMNSKNTATPTTSNTPTTPTPTTPVSATDTAFQAYLKSLQPTTAENNANQNVLDLQNKQEALTQGFREQQNATLDAPGGLVSGAQQAASLEGRRASTSLADLAVQENAAARTAGLYQNQRTAGADAAKTTLDYISKQQEATKPVSVNNQSYQLNLATGKYEPMTNSGSVGGVGGLSSDAVDFWAQAGASGVSLNSLLPSMGMGSAAVATKQALLEKMADNATTLGIDGSTFGAMLADSKAKTATYSAVQKQGTQTKVNEDSANKYFDTLNTLATKVDSSVASPVLEGWIRSGQVKLTGDSNTNLFLSQLTEALTEYAKVMSGQTTGAGVAQFANEQAKGLLDKGLSAQAIKDFTVLAKQNMKGRTDSYDTALKGLFGSISSLKDTSGGLGSTTTNDTSGSSTGGWASLGD